MSLDSCSHPHLETSLTFSIWKCQQRIEGEESVEGSRGNFICSLVCACECFFFQCFECFLVQQFGPKSFKVGVYNPKLHLMKLNAASVFIKSVLSAAALNSSVRPKRSHEASDLDCPRANSFQRRLFTSPISPPQLAQPAHSSNTLAWCHPRGGAKLDILVDLQRAGAVDLAR